MAMGSLTPPRLCTKAILLVVCPKLNASYALVVTLLHMQHTTALNPGSVKMPPPAEIPEELKEYYASLTMEPSDVLSFGYQIASGMVSKITYLELDPA